MIVETDFLDHWKTQMLVQTSGFEIAPFWVLRLWAHCQNRKSHVFINFPPEALKAVCRFQGHANKLESWLLTSGFIRREDSKLIVHQWEDYNAGLIANWENGKLGGRPKSEPKKEPKGNPSITHGLTMGNPSVTHQEPIDKKDKINKINKNIEDVPNFTKFVRLWELAFQQAFNSPYVFGKGRDGLAINALLRLKGMTVEEFIEIAKKAWAVTDEKAGWHCVRQSKTIHGFSTYFNQIRNDLGMLKVEKVETKDYGWGKIS